MKIDPGKRYNARGERFCIGCHRYLAVEWFVKDPSGKDGLRARCRPCLNTQMRRQRAKRYQNDATWRRDVERSNASHRRCRETRIAATRAAVVFTVNALLDRGFSHREIAALSDVDPTTILRYRHGQGQHFRLGCVERLDRVLRAAADLPIVGRPRPGLHHPPHPDLGLVRARLDRMAYLAELEAA